MLSKFPFFSWPLIWPHMSSCFFFFSKMQPDLYCSLTQGHKAISLFRYQPPSLILFPHPSLCVVSPLAPRWRSFWHHTQQNHPKGPNGLSSGPWHHLVAWGKTFTHLTFVDCMLFVSMLFNFGLLCGPFCFPFLGLPAVFCAFLWLLWKCA